MYENLDLQKMLNAGGGLFALQKEFLVNGRTDNRVPFRQSVSQYV